MKSVLAALLICSSLLFNAEGLLINGSSRCQCRNGFIKSPARFRHQMKDFRVFYPTIFCPQTEIIIKMKKGSFCVDPASPFGKHILLRKTQEVSSTSASTGFPLSSTRARTGTTSQL